MNRIVGFILGTVLTLLSTANYIPNSSETNWICKPADSDFDSFSVNLKNEWRPEKKTASSSERIVTNGKFVSNRKATMEISSFRPNEGKDELFKSVRETMETFVKKAPERLRIIKWGEETILITFLKSGVLPNRKGQVIRATRTNFDNRFTVIEAQFPDFAKVDELVEVERAIKSLKVLPK